MYLNYVFENMRVPVLESPATHVNNQWFEPHYRREIMDVEYEFEVDVKFKDFFDFLKPYDFKEWKKEGQDAYEIACKNVFNSCWFDLEALEEDEDFIQFMKERYEDEAREKCEEDYE